MESATTFIDMVCILLNPIAKKIGNLVNLEASVTSLTNKMEELKEMRDDIKRRVDEAELRLLTCKQQVKGWLQRVEHVENEVDLIVEEINGKMRKRCFGVICCVKYCTSSYYRLSKKVAEKLKEVEELKSKGVFDTVVADELITPPTVIPMPSTNSAVGVDAMLEKVRRFLREEDDVGIIGLYGMGGVGKTTLLRKINNEFILGAHGFDVVIWALVSKDFVLEKIQKAVWERLGLDWKESESMDERAKVIFNVLRKKRFILLLDDVWERVDLEKLGIPAPDKKNKCKVLFTTRDSHVSRSMDAQSNLKVEFLNEEQAWQLFSEKVGNNAILDSPSIRPMAEIILKKCGGLPLALITVGRAMANKEAVEEWKDAIRVLNKSPSELRGMEDVFTLLKFSYDNLQDDTLRSCFLYCSLFPEDYSIEKEQLIDYWIGEGLLDAFDDCDVRYKGHALIGALKVSCMLEDGEEDTQVKTHDVIRSTALWIASECGKKNNKFLVEASIGLTAAPKAEKWKEAEKVSLMDNNIGVLTEIPICHDLQTLMLQWNSSLNKIPNGFFQFMPSLRVLDLSFTSLKELPVSIGRLVELRHLDLSATKLTILPNEIGSLANLRHLDLQRTYYLQKIPSKAIAKLGCLQLLNLYYSYPDWEEEEGCEDEKSACFDNLEGLACLTSLGITITAVSTLFRLACLNNLPKCVQYLYITKCEGLTHFQPSSASGNAERIRRLSIYSCDELEELVIGKEAGDNWLPSLEFLSLHSLPSLTAIWRRPVTPGCLQNLRYITIWRCDKLKNLTWVLQLCSLEVLYIFECKEIEEVISGNQVQLELVAFPKLRKLSIQNLPKLRIIHQHKLAFPSLNTFAVIKCPELKKFPFKAPNETKVPPIIYGTREWWDGLQWEEDDNKAMFDSYFIVT